MASLAALFRITASHTLCAYLPTYTSRHTQYHNYIPRGGKRRGMYEAQGIFSGAEPGASSKARYLRGTNGRRCRI